jgi:5-enolpyruvylshikimate-3-phosphate synthase
MTNPIIKIHNLETGEEIEREMNAAEFAQYKIDQEAAAALKVEETNKAAAKAALLDRLGITAEEATLLFA